MENEIKSALRDGGFAFKKRLGQNFITDGALLASIVSGAGVTAGDTVVEIGCGAGTLTRAIAASAMRVISYEVDKSLQPVLAHTLAGIDNAEIVFADFLKADMRALEKRIVGPYKVVANIPYYVTTPIITKILEEAKYCQTVCVMVQEEVALRLCSRENTPDYGAITAIIALYGGAKIIKKVPREAFTPKPKVNSAVVRIDIGQGNVKSADPELYKRTVHAAFAARRKTLENNLVAAFGLTREQASCAIAECRLTPTVRGEALSPQKFEELAAALKKYVNNG